MPFFYRLWFSEDLTVRPSRYSYYITALDWPTLKHTCSRTVKTFYPGLPKHSNISYTDSIFYMQYLLSFILAQEQLQLSILAHVPGAWRDDIQHHFD